MSADERAAAADRLSSELDGYAGPAMAYLEARAPIPERLVAAMEDAHRAARQFVTDTVEAISRLDDLIDEGEATHAAGEAEEERRRFVAAVDALPRD